MTVETLQYLSIVSFVLAGICFLAAVLLFIVCRIPVVIGDLSGVNARKAIEKICRQQEEIEEISEFCVPKDDLQRIEKTTLLGQSEQIPIVVEYEIGFWASEEIIDVGCCINSS